MLLIQILLFIILALCVANVTDVQHIKLVKKWRNHWKSQAIHYKSQITDLQQTNAVLRDRYEIRLKRIKVCEQRIIELEKLYNTAAYQQEPERGFKITNIDNEPIGKPIEQEDGYNWANIDSQTR